jgi:DNA-binding response OmpR family regulator
MSTILLIEDNHEVRENTAEILELANYHVVTAENGKVGVEKALEETPDLISWMAMASFTCSTRTLFSRMCPSFS